MNEIRKVAVLIETSRETGRDLLRGVTRFFQENPHWSIYFQQQDLGAALPRWIRSWDGDGILSRVTDQKTAKVLINTGLPLVDLRGATHEFGRPLFGVDNRSVTRLAYDHLVSCGLHQFAFVGEPTGRHEYDDERLREFVRLVEQEDERCHVFSNQKSGKVSNSWEAQQKSLAQWLKKLPKPIGVMCCHDDRGQQVLDACQRARLSVPDEVAVMGVDNDEFLCRLANPPLTSIDIGTEHIGYEAAALLDRLMNGEAQFSDSVLFDAVRVEKRQSTDLIACDDIEIAKALRFIRDNACNQLTVDDIERHVLLSRTVLNRRFKKVVGHSPKKEILRVQMDKAMQLLVTSSAPLQVIADQCGFSEAWYFISVFRKYMGTTPGVFRKRHLRKKSASDK